MAASGVEVLLDLWENEPGFRDALRRDPETTVRASGVELSEEEWHALRSIDWGQSDEALARRASKAA